MVQIYSRTYNVKFVGMESAVKCVTIMSIVSLLSRSAYSIPYTSPSSIMQSYATSWYTYSYWNLKLVDAATYDPYVDNGIDAFGPDSDFEFLLMLAPHNISSCGFVDWNDFKTTYYQFTAETHGLLVDITEPSKNCSIDEIIYNIRHLKIPTLNYIMFSQGYKADFDTLLDKSLAINQYNPSYDTYAPTEYTTATGMEHSQPPSSDLTTGIVVDDGFVYGSSELPTIVFLLARDLQNVVGRIKESARYEGTSPYYVSDGFIYWNFRVILSSLYSPPNYLSGSSGQYQPSSAKTASFVTAAFVGVGFLLIAVGVLFIHAKTRSEQLATHDPSSTQANVPNNPQNPTANSQANNNETKAALTFEEFEALPRIHYNRTQTYSMRKNLHSKDDIHYKGDRSVEIPVDTIAENRVNESDEQGTQSLHANVSIHSIILSDNNIHESETHLNNTGVSDHTISGVGNEMCSICVEEFHNDEVIVMLPECKHLYHSKCLGLWVLDRKSDFCPLCKVKVINREKSIQQENIPSGGNIQSPENDNTHHNSTSNDAMSTIPVIQHNNNNDINSINNPNDVPIQSDHHIASTSIHHEAISSETNYSNRTPSANLEI